MSINPADLGAAYDTVLDVGAFRGDFARACLERWPKCVVHSFEPLEPQPADQCCVNDPEVRWLWHPCALGNNTGRVTMYRNEFVPSSSVLPMANLHRKAFPYTERTEEVEVGMAVLDEFAAAIEAPALLKIDVQGYELEVLRGASVVLTKCDGVVLEVSHEVLYEHAPRPLDLERYLEQAGFEHRARVDALYHPKKPKLLLQSDEFWARP